MVLDYNQVDLKWNIIKFKYEFNSKFQNTSSIEITIQTWILFEVVFPRSLNLTQLSAFKYDLFDFSLIMIMLISKFNSS